jgi:hypothetical protein
MRRDEMRRDENKSLDGERISVKIVIFELIVENSMRLVIF